MLLEKLPEFTEDDGKYGTPIINYILILIINELKKVIIIIIIIIIENI